ncbi:MAG: tRNA guanosine(34) transglycosylase Tgt [Legionellales bacterium]|nr:tRNA guanosine(34) transglycosylase Tgt [Legionellales bacterium]|tara:strand:+ start:14893 stop:16041 length:1149 start_codon:yes stop_codon:yes gene_type:complete
MTFNTEIIKQHPSNQARVTKVTTHHGEFTTPAFMPVGTKAVVNCMSPRDLTEAGSEIILGGNTYHMLCTPGMDIIQTAGGMHEFMGWNGPMLTDSGGFQVFSLSKDSKICIIDEDGAHFRHPVTNQVINLTPTSSLETQKIIGADIIMAFDQCTADSNEKDFVVKAMERTHRWLLSSIDYHTNNPTSVYGYPQALFGIIQGSYFQDLREASAEFVTSQNLDGIAIGGETIGFDMDKTREILNWVQPYLPANKLRYTMGVGLHPQNLIDVVAQGIDVFDCVAPTRNARHGSLYGSKIHIKDNWVWLENEESNGIIHIKKSKYAKDNSPLVEDCDCHTCQNYTRSYMHFLFKERALAYYNLACVHNIRMLHRVCEAMRQCIMDA